ncbi:lipopolysaccharide biosynthesis protein [Mesorhizobium waimense]|uniref:Lipopolysaccharide biosynthesis protein n=2 Tax=Mesorhizobium waimense TaxID=1300307 RepID=A0A3A5KVD6_9HYPH|nr:lipopolysaccharide biosynthesis protein [Mesorhizobium waimense]
MDENISNRSAISGVSTSPAADDMRMSIATLARNGAVAGVIKLASAGLSFLMFVAVAMVMDGRQFGLYSATYAGASLVSFFASVGQQSTVLRFWPQYVGLGDHSSAHGMMARAILVALAGLVGSSLLILMVGFLPFIGKDTPEWLSLCVAAAVLSFALGWSEFTSGAFRAKNALISGLLPRDIIWRAGTIAAIAACHFMHIEMSAVAATYLTALLLILSVVPQTLLLVRDTVRAKRGPLSEGQKREFKTVTLGLWGVTSLPPALGQVSTLLVAVILGPEAAGAIFVADRTTRFVALALNGINQALAPQISSAFYSGDRAHVQRITNLAALGSFAIALCVLAAFWMFGGLILSMFNPTYDTPTMRATLVIFGIGATFATACGPIEILLQLTGLQHALFKVLVVVNILGLGATAVTTYFFGPIGAAVSIAGTVIAWTAIAVSIARRRIGINPSVFGFTMARAAPVPSVMLKGRT